MVAAAAWGGQKGVYCFVCVLNRRMRSQIHNAMTTVQSFSPVWYLANLLGFAYECEYSKCVL